MLFALIALAVVILGYAVILIKAARSAPYAAPDQSRLDNLDRPER